MAEAQQAARELIQAAGLDYPERLEAIFRHAPEILKMDFEQLQKLNQVIESAMRGCGRDCGGC